MGAQIKGFSRLDLRLEFNHLNKSGVSLAAYVQNVTNAVYVVGTNNQLNAATATVADLYGPPRFYGVELKFEY
jgi:iron complex outermembrane receptor protein